MVAPAAAGVKQQRGGHLAVPCRRLPCSGQSTGRTHVDALAKQHCSAEAEEGRGGREPLPTRALNPAFRVRAVPSYFGRQLGDHMPLLSRC